MCMVSVVQQYAGTVVDAASWTRPLLTEYQEILARIERLDAKLGEPDCEDPAKAAWMRDVEARLALLESGAKT